MRHIDGFVRMLHILYIITLIKLLTSMKGTLTRTNSKGNVNMWYSNINFMPWSRHDYLNTVSNTNNYHIYLKLIILFI